MTRKTKINPRTRKAIRTYVKQGLSGNKIQKRLQKSHLGIRRKVLFIEIRRIKHQKAKPYPERHVPRKYRKPSMIPIITRKHVTLTGYHHHKRETKTKIGSGRELHSFVRREMESDYWDEKPTADS